MLIDRREDVPGEMTTNNHRTLLASGFRHKTAVLYGVALLCLAMDVGVSMIVNHGTTPPLSNCLYHFSWERGSYSATIHMLPWKCLTGVILLEFSRVVIQWIPAHCGIPGNNKADLLAKDGSQQQQESPSTSYNEAKMLLKQAHHKTWQRKRGDHGRYTLLHLSRKEATTIFRLRTGHCRLREHLKRMNLSESARCVCQEADQTPRHVLLDCLPTVEDTERPRLARWSNTCQTTLGISR
jgi:hypothetical protein